MRLSTGIYNVTANQGNANAAYATQTLTRRLRSILPTSRKTVNFTLSKGGAHRRLDPRDGINPLQGVSVVAFDSNGRRGAAMKSQPPMAPSY